ncbi:unnamed protein product [Cochlearia groenlandica]
MAQSNSTSPSLLPNPHSPPFAADPPPFSSSSSRGSSAANDGKLKVQSQPPASLIHALADATTQNPKKKDKPKKKNPTSSSSFFAVSAASAPIERSQPKLSKAARRFYNENFRETPQRLRKVLTAAGDSSRRTFEELIFDGKVTVTGSLCITPQTRVDPTRDIIYVTGNRVPKKLPPKVYFDVNKPKGYITTVVGDVHKRHLMAISEGTIVEGVRCVPDLVELLPKQHDIPRARIRIVVMRLEERIQILEEGAAAPQRQAAAEAQGDAQAQGNVVVA